MRVTEPGKRLPVHRLHDEEIERLLATGERRAELTAMFGEQAYRELSALARRAAATRALPGPRVYVLPGLMGSRIGSRGVLLDDVLWVDIVEIAAGHLTRLALPGGSKLLALGAMLLNTLKLKLSLQIAGFDTRLHAYDWRRSVGALAGDLNARIAAEAGRRPIMLVGHSMGGVVARVAYGRQGVRRITRVVQLGAPNHGSYAPVLALRGVYPTVRKLAALDRRHSAEDFARIVFRTLPSLHELLPDPRLTGGTSLFEPAQWPHDALRPDPALLQAAAAEQSRWPRVDEHCLHIVGVRQDTVTAATLQGAEFEFTLTAGGDGTVPLTLAAQPDDRAWFVGEKHGGLPNNGRVIAAVVDLLRTGATARLPQAATPPRTRSHRAVSEASLRRIAPHKVRWQDLSPDARRRLLEPVVSPEFHGAVELGALQPRRRPLTGARPAGQRMLEIRLMRGSIVDANARALVLGVFPNVDPSGAAAAVDARLGGAIREFTRRRMFTGRLGEISGLPPTRGVLLAESVVFAGLGDFDDFGSDAQSFVAGNIVRSLAMSGVEDFATVLFGAGSGVPVAAALEQQLGGFVAGLRDADPDRVIRRITICEIDARKYAALRRAALRLAERLSSADLRVVVDETDTRADDTATERARDARAATQRVDPVYLLVTLLGQGRSDFDCRSSLLTAGAKAAVLSSTVRLARKKLDAHLATAESGALTPKDMARFGNSLAKLLIGSTVLHGLAAMRRRPLVIVHDREASRVPWETLRVGDTCPALEQGLSRRYTSESLTVARWQEHRSLGPQLRVLMVVDPALDLPGAAREGAAISRVLRAGGAELTILSGRDATRERLLRDFGGGRHDVLHFAGHGFFDAREPGRSGLVCAEGEVLRGADLDGLGDLPALVFFNACEAARVRRRRATTGGRLFAFRRSTSVAEAFLGGGVANFLGTHWPVGDEAALAFSTRFYERLLADATLGEAVLAARQRVFEQGSVDWADYVHYGNFSFRLGAL
jgi:hypothetical protein